MNILRTVIPALFLLLMVAFASSANAKPLVTQPVDERAIENVVRTEFKTQRVDELLKYLEDLASKSRSEAVTVIVNRTLTEITALIRSAHDLREAADLLQRGAIMSFVTSVVGLPLLDSPGP